MLQILPTQGDHKTGVPGAVAAKALWLDLLNPALVQTAGSGPL